MPALPWGPPGRGQDPNWVSDKVGEQPSITSCHCQSYHAFPCTFFSLSFCLETTQLGPVFCPLLFCVAFKMQPRSLMTTIPSSSLYCWPNNSYSSISLFWAIRPYLTLLILYQNKVRVKFETWEH